MTAATLAPAASRFVARVCLSDRTEQPVTPALLAHFRRMRATTSGESGLTVGKQRLAPHAGQFPECVLPCRRGFFFGHGQWVGHPLADPRAGTDKGRDRDGAGVTKRHGRAVPWRCRVRRLQMS